MAYLDVDRLTKHFGGLAAVNNVSFGVEKGEIVGLIGPNGAGKTTVFNLVNGFLAPTSGEVRFKGERIDGMKPHRVCRAGIARTFQVVKPLQRMSVLDNVIASSFLRHPTLSAARKHAEGILDLTGLHDVAPVISKGLPLGLRKRLEIARALATQPELLLLDEACAGLNPTELDQNIAIIRRIADSGITLLVIEHHMKVIMSLSHRIVVISFGQKIAEGTPAEVTSNPGVVAAYLGGGEADH
ncbi:MAG: ABC transporter ATP-binding protein, partial [Deltaproteobacteria bacterium]|nr:ABC transporter ATP-binding protein [Deltaproteobacteria bacterium]